MAKQLLVLLTILLLATLGCSQPTNSPTAAPTAIPASATTPKLPVIATVDLGVIRQGQSIRHAAWLKNSSKQPVQIIDIKKGCECLSVELAKRTIEPYQRILVDLHYDGAKEPDFLGSLQVEVELIGENQTTVGRIEVPVEVIRNDKPDAS